MKTSIWPIKISVVRIENQFIAITSFFHLVFRKMASYNESLPAKVRAVQEKWDTLRNSLWKRSFENCMNETIIRSAETVEGFSQRPLVKFNWASNTTDNDDRVRAFNADTPTCSDMFDYRQGREGHQDDDGQQRTPDEPVSHCIGCNDVLLLDVIPIDTTFFAERSLKEILNKIYEYVSKKKQHQ